jgi:hypothetical protein
MSMHATMDVVAANRDLGRRFFAEQDRVRGGPVPEVCTEDYVATLGGNPPMDRAGHEGFAKLFYGGFPDLYHTVEDVFATEDRVFVRFVIRGTHTGNLFGIPATGRPATIVANIAFRVLDGKVASLTGVFDEAGMLRQLGVIA